MLEHLKRKPSPPSALSAARGGTRGVGAPSSTRRVRQQQQQHHHHHSQQRYQVMYHQQPSGAADDYDDEDDDEEDDGYEYSYATTTTRHASVPGPAATNERYYHNQPSSAAPSSQPSSSSAHHHHHHQHAGGSSSGGGSYRRSLKIEVPHPNDEATFWRNSNGNTNSSSGGGGRSFSTPSSSASTPSCSSHGYPTDPYVFVDRYNQRLMESRTSALARSTFSPGSAAAASGESSDYGGHTTTSAGSSSSDRSSELSSDDGGGIATTSAGGPNSPNFWPSPVCTPVVIERRNSQSSATGPPSNMTLPSPHHAPSTPGSTTSNKRGRSGHVVGGEEEMDGAGGGYEGAASSQYHQDVNGFHHYHHHHYHHPQPVQGPPSKRHQQAAQQQQTWSESHYPSPSAASTAAVRSSWPSSPQPGNNSSSPTKSGSSKADYSNGLLRLSAMAHAAMEDPATVRSSTSPVHRQQPPPSWRTDSPVGLTKDDEWVQFREKHVVTTASTSRASVIRNSPRARATIASSLTSSPGSSVLRRARVAALARRTSQLSNGRHGGSMRRTYTETTVSSLSSNDDDFEDDVEHDYDGFSREHLHEETKTEWSAPFAGGAGAAPPMTITANTERGANKLSISTTTTTLSSTSSTSWCGEDGMEGSADCDQAAMQMARMKLGGKWEEADIAAAADALHFLASSSTESTLTPLPPVLTPKKRDEPQMMWGEDRYY